MLYLNRIQIQNLEEEETFYFCDNPTPKGYPVPEDCLAGLKEVIHALDKKHLYTSFARRTEGFFPICLKRTSQTASFFKSYQHYKIHKKLRLKSDLLVHGDFTKEIISYVKNSNSDDGISYVSYDVFSLRFGGPTAFESYVSVKYHQQIHILKRNIPSILSEICPMHIKELKIDQFICCRECVVNAPHIDITSSFPVLNNELFKDLGLSKPPVSKFNYKDTWDRLQNFYQNYIESTGLFMSPALDELPWRPISKNQYFKAKNKHQKTDLEAWHHNWHRDLFMPKRKKEKQLCIFFILPRECNQTTQELIDQVRRELPAQDQHLQLHLHADKSREIRYTSCNKLCAEVAQTLCQTGLDQNTRYLVGVVPTCKSGRKKMNEAYSKLAELLLKKEIMPCRLSALNNSGLSIAKESKHQHQNLSVKLGQRSWALHHSGFKELIIGMALFTNKQGQTFLGVTVYCMPQGEFIHFSCLNEGSVGLLPGKLDFLIRKCSQNQGPPSRIIFHCYENTVTDSSKTIMARVKQIQTKIPITMVHICRGKSMNNMAFNLMTKTQIPESGTCIYLGGNAFLLCSQHANVESDTFPLELKFQGMDAAINGRMKTFRHDVNQIYALSQMHVDVLQNRALPATIYLPLRLVKEFARMRVDQLPFFASNHVWFV